MRTLYQSIAAQVAASLREETRTMAAGENLPGERELARRMQVSRKTIRKALAILRAEGLVATRSSSATSVLSSGGRKADGKTARIHLLLPETLEESRPFTALWIHQFGSLLHASGCRFDVISGRQYYGLRVDRLLKSLVASHPSDCWILTRSNEPLQRWFSEHRHPAIIAGSAFPGVSLPSVDVDHLALGHHAAAQFLRHGHARTALFLEQEGHAGDAETVQGFTEAFAQAGAAPPVVSRVAREPESVIAEVRRLRQRRSPPTGFLLCNAFSYLTVQSYLASLGLLVPRDVSLISQDEGPFLSHLHPDPARYVTNSRKYAVALNRIVKRVLANDVESDFKIRIMPDYIRGGSVARTRGSA